MSWKRFGLMILACPVGALLGMCLTGFLVANPINLLVRAAMERNAISAKTGELIVPAILAIAAIGGGAGFVLAGCKTGAQEVHRGVLAGYFMFVSFLLLLPEITIHPIPNIALWIGFILGGLVAAVKKQKTFSNALHANSAEAAPQPEH